MNAKFIKVRYKNEAGLDLFKEYPAPSEAYEISEVELIEHKEHDKILDLVKSKNA